MARRPLTWNIRVREATHAQKADEAGQADTTGHANTSDKAAHATTADTASRANTADKATHAVTADAAARAKTADEATHAATADIAHTAETLSPQFCQPGQVLKKKDDDTGWECADWPVNNGVVLNLPSISGFNWPHGDILQIPASILQLHELKCDLSHDLHSCFFEGQLRLQVVQVWFEPLWDLDGLLGQPHPLQTADPLDLAQKALSGRVNINEPRKLSWEVVHNDDFLWDVLAAGRTTGVTGRILIRIHCSILFDDERRPFSPRLDMLYNVNGIQPPYPLGGIFESWFFVEALARK